MEDAVDAMPNISPNYTATPRLGVLLNHVAKLPEQSAGFDQLDSLFETLSSGFGYADRVGISFRLVSHIVCLIQIAVVSLVV